MTRVEASGYETLLDQLDPQARASTRTRRFVYGLVLSGVIGAVVYLTTGSAVVAGAVVGAATVILGLIDVGTAFFILFSVITLEGIISPSQTFSISKVVGVLVLLSFLLHAQWRKLRLPAPFPLMVLLLLFGAMSVLWSWSPDNALRGLLTWTLNIGLLVLMVSYVRGIRQLDILMWALIVSSLLGSVLVSTGLGRTLGEHEAAREVGRVALGEQDSPVHLANKILLGYLATIYIFLRYRSPWRYVLLLACLPMIWTIIWTQTRIALLSLVLVPFLAFAFSAGRRNVVRFSVAALVVVIMGLVLFQLLLQSDLLPEKAQERLVETKDTAVEHRLAMWTQGLRVFARHFVTGAGLNNFDIVVDSKHRITAAHNNIVSIAGELGIVGLLLCGAIYVSLLTNSRRIYFTPLRWVAFAMVIVSFLTGMTSTTCYFKYFWYALGLATVASQVDRDGQLALANMGRHHQSQ